MIGPREAGPEAQRGLIGVAPAAPAHSQWTWPLPDCWCLLSSGLTRVAASRALLPSSRVGSAEYIWLVFCMRIRNCKAMGGHTTPCICKGNRPRLVPSSPLCLASPGGLPSRTGSPRWAPIASTLSARWRPGNTAQEHSLAPRFKRRLLADPGTREVKTKIPWPKKAGARPHHPAADEGRPGIVDGVGLVYPGVRRSRAWGIRGKARVIARLRAPRTPVLERTQGHGPHARQQTVNSRLW